MAEFDEALKSRLLAFQRAHGLAEDALVGAKTWTKLAEGADATSTKQPESRAESGGDAPTAGTTAATVAHAATITPASFPLLFAIAEKCRDENGMENFLREDIGVDVSAILADMDRVLGTDSQGVSAQ